MAGSLGASRFWVLWLGVLPLVAWALVRGFGLEGHSRLAPLISFTPYAAIGALFLLGLCVAVRNWPAAALGAVALAVLAFAVLPRAVGSGEAPPPGSTRVTVMSANVFHGLAKPAALMALIDRVEPDVLSVQELNRGLAMKLRRLGIEREFPHSMVTTRHGPTDRRLFSGAGLYSRHPLRRLPGPDPANSRMQAAELALPHGWRLKVINVHPFTPTGPAPTNGRPNSGISPAPARASPGCSPETSTPPSTTPCCGRFSTAATATPRP